MTDSLIDQEDAAVVALLDNQGSAVLGELRLVPRDVEGLTEERIFQPFTSSGLKVGFSVQQRTNVDCGGSSNVVARAYRCLTEEGLVLDPCFASPFASPELACAATPWGDLVMATPVGSLPGLNGELGGVPWALELESEERCVFVGGATAVLAEERLNYQCESGGSIYGFADRSSEPWVIRYEDSAAQDIVLVGVARAWL